MVQLITKKLAQRELFPYHTPRVIQHNTNIILTYFTRKQHTLYENIIRENDLSIQNKGPRHISPPLNIPLVKISTHECNPKKYINTNTNKIQVQDDIAHIYDETCKHLITIPNKTCMVVKLIQSNSTPTTRLNTLYPIF